MEHSRPVAMLAFAPRIRCANSPGGEAAPTARHGKHATVKVAGAAITALLEWARISEFRSEGSPVETVRRRLPKRAGGSKHHDAVHWSEVGSVLARIDAGQCMPSTKRAIRFTALTAARQVEVRRTTWDQFDLANAVWVIYETNLRSSYAAGRWRQLQDVKERRPYWRYRHSPASVDARPEHVDWDGLILPADDPWWKTNYPPNGWGCRCFVESLSRRDLDRLGKEGPDEAPPLDETETTVGSGVSRRTARTPAGVDPGFAHAPGSTSALADAVRRRLYQTAAQQPRIAALGTAETLAGGVDRPLAALAEEWRAWRRSTGSDGPGEFALGALSTAVVDGLRRAGIEVSTAFVRVDRQRLGHMTRDTKNERGAALADADIDRLPEIIARPEAVLHEPGEPATSSTCSVPPTGPRARARSSCG